MDVVNRPISRRGFIGGAGAGALALGAVGITPQRAYAPRFSDYPFKLGVASGDPSPDGFVIWTRLAPDPLQGGGMPPRPVAVSFEVAHDEAFRRIAAAGTATARPQRGHSVHAEIEGLRPGREYFYRFSVGRDTSRTGRTKTAPAPGSSPAALRFAVASCQSWQEGHYTAYRHMAAEELDFVLHLGDYVYEGAQSADAIRPHEAGEPTDLLGYRNRHALYRTDADLQAAHAAFPFVVTWDDHEVENNYAAGLAQRQRDRDADPAAFRARRGAAYQAYCEHLPLRRSTRARRNGPSLHRRLAFGDLAELNVLDTRRRRARQACGGWRRTGCADRLDPGRTMLGAEQERWLLEGLHRSRARWNVLAQQVFFAQLDLDPGPRQSFSMEAWDGYAAARDRLLSGIATRGVANPVVLTGDVHRNWACEVKSSFADPESATIATEFVGTSISSGRDGTDLPADSAGLLAANPHLRFTNGQRGYLRCDLDRDSWRTDFRVLAYVTRPGAPISTRASFVVEDGRPGPQPG